MLVPETVQWNVVVDEPVAGGETGTVVVCVVLVGTGDVEVVDEDVEDVVVDVTGGLLAVTTPPGEVVLVARVREVAFPPPLGSTTGFDTSDEDGWGVEPVERTREEGVATTSWRSRFRIPTGLLADVP